MQVLSECLLFFRQVCDVCLRVCVSFVSVCVFVCIVIVFHFHTCTYIVERSVKWTGGQWSLWASLSH